MNAVSRMTILPAAKTTRELEEAEFLILWAARVWTAHRRAGAALCGGFGRAFQMAGVPGGTALLHAILEITLAGAARGLDIRCVRCSRVGRDETFLLAALGAAQRHDFAACQEMLAMFLAPTAVRAVHARMATLGHHLTATGLRLPLRSLDAASERSQGLARPRCPDPGAALVH